MDLELPPVEPGRPEWRENTPFAGDFGDSYFMPGRGVDESRVVFIEANRLAERFAALPADGVFVIGETGFGTGLNCLLAAQCFLDHAPANARLHLLSAERHPLEPRDLVRALAAWPDLAGPAQALIERYPPLTPGFHRIRLLERISLTLMFGDALTMWQHCEAAVDAWFLDGFAPARNPAMWSDELFGALARRSRPGGSAATFTAAGSVRRGLAAAGFETCREPGFGPKRHRLTARFRGNWQPQRSSRGRAVIAGAGIAGATTARALAERGWQVTVCDPALAGTAPEHLAGVVYATASARLNAQNRLYQSALIHALRWLAAHGFPRHADHGRLAGVVQHLLDPRQQHKVREAMASGAWPESLLERIDDESVRFRSAGYLQPGAWCRHLLDHAGIETRAVRVAGWRSETTPMVDLDDGEPLCPDALILCTAGATRDLPGLAWLPLRLVRGQVTFCRATAASRGWRQPHCHAGYVTPAIGGMHSIGATFDRTCEQPVERDEDNRANLDSLAAHLPDRYQALGGKAIDTAGHHAGVRCQSPDTLPLAGPLPDPNANPHCFLPGIWLNIAHGSRGLTHTPLCADLIADSLSGHPLPVDTSIVDALAPERLIMRKRRKAPDWIPDR